MYQVRGFRNFITTIAKFNIVFQQIMTKESWPRRTKTTSFRLANDMLQRSLATRTRTQNKLKRREEKRKWFIKGKGVASPQPRLYQHGINCKKKRRKRKWYNKREGVATPQPRLSHHCIKSNEKRSDKERETTYLSHNHEIFELGQIQRVGEDGARERGKAQESLDSKIKPKNDVSENNRVINDGLEKMEQVIKNNLQKFWILKMTQKMTWQRTIVSEKDVLQNKNDVAKIKKMK